MFGVPVVREDDALRARPRRGRDARARSRSSAVARSGADRRQHRARSSPATRRGHGSSRRRPSRSASGSSRPAAPGEVLLGEPTHRARPRRGRRRAGRAARRSRARPSRLPRTGSVASTRGAPAPRPTSAVRRPRARARLLREAWERVAAEQRCAGHVVGDGRRRQVAPHRRARSRRSRRASCAAVACPTARASPTGRSSRSWSSSTRCRPTMPRPPPIRALLGETDAPTRRTRSRGRSARLLEDAAASGRSSSSSTTSTGARRRFLDLVEQTALPRRARRSCCSAWPGPSCSSAARLAGRRCASSRSASRRSTSCSPARDRRRAARADRRGRGRQPAVRPGDARDRRPRRTARSACRRRCRRCSPRASTGSTPGERRVLERGAVEGEIFHRGAVQALAPATSTPVPPRLAALVRKELVRPDRPQLRRRGRASASSTS